MVDSKGLPRGVGPNRFLSVSPLYERFYILLCPCVCPVPNINSVSFNTLLCLCVFPVPNINYCSLEDSRRLLDRKLLGNNKKFCAYQKVY